MTALLLIHGLGATHRVWDGWRDLLEQRWNGRWIAPDLPGHGGAEPLESYTFESMTAALARQLDTGDPLVVIGHSLGGVIGIALADRQSGVPVQRVVGLGIKVRWSADDLAKAAALAARPVAWYDSREEAAARYLRVSGLQGLTDAPPDGLVTENSRWRLAMDPATFGVGAPDMPRLLAASQAEVILARGEHDPMNTDEQLAELSRRTVTLPGLGHNAHVEDPEAVFSLLDR